MRDVRLVHRILATVGSLAAFAVAAPALPADAQRSEENSEVREPVVEPARASAPPVHLLRVELMLGSLVSGRGLLAEGSVSVHRGSGFFFVTLPRSVYIPRPGWDASTGVQGYVGGGAQGRFGSGALSVGLARIRPWGDGEDASPPSRQTTLGVHARIGSLDGASFTTDVTFATPGFSGTGFPLARADVGLHVPLSPKLLVSVRGGLWLTEQSNSDLQVGARYRLRGNGAGGSWYVRAAASVIWPRHWRTASSGYETTFDPTVGLSLGMERRFGGAPPTTSREPAAMVQTAATRDGSGEVVGTVTRTHADLVFVTPNAGAPIAVGQHVRLRVAEDAPHRAPNTVVGEVERLRTDGAVARIGPNESVAPGYAAELTSQPRTSTTLVPALPTHVVRFELMAGSLFAQRGGFAEATVSLHRGAGHFFVTLPPSLFMAGLTADSHPLSSAAGVQGVVGGGLQHRLISADLSVGVAPIRPEAAPDGPTSGALARPKPTLGIHARIGAFDGLGVRADLTLPVASSEQSIYRLLVGLQVPLVPKALLSVRFGSWFTGRGYTDLHIGARYRLSGTGDGDSWYVRGAFAAFWTHHVVLDTATTTTVYREVPQGPTFGAELGVERRFGLPARPQRLGRP